MWKRNLLGLGFLNVVVSNSVLKTEIFRGKNVFCLDQILRKVVQLSLGKLELPLGIRNIAHGEIIAAQESSEKLFSNCYSYV